MKRVWVFVVLVLLAGLLAGCVPRDNSGNNSNNKTTTRSYGVDCGNAQQIGSGSCGMTITDVFIGIGGGGQ